MGQSCFYQITELYSRKLVAFNVRDQLSFPVYDRSVQNASSGEKFIPNIAHTCFTVLSVPVRKCHPSTFAFHVSAYL
jgi:hypothetical protein